MVHLATPHMSAAPLYMLYMLRSRLVSVPRAVYLLLLVVRREPWSEWAGVQDKEPYNEYLGRLDRRWQNHGCRECDCASS
jgi:hypothetical protein